MKKQYSGIFITMEGGEGSGKTTLAKRICEEFIKQGKNAVVAHEPGGTPLSEALRKLILTPQKEYAISGRSELFLYLAARAEHVEEFILPSLINGMVVICDRFNDSSVAYQGFGRKLGKEYVETLCKMATEGLSDPDVTLFLDVDPLLGMKRVKMSRKAGLDRLEQEKLAFHQEVRRGYMSIASEHQDRIEVIDGSRSIEDVLAACILVLKKKSLLL